jgi:predicted nucleic acid-binding Zn ribbon protein
MHCPSCGTETSKNKKFCRSCGMGLQMISQAVAKHLSTADSSEPPGESEASKQRRMSTLLFWGIAAFIVGIALIVVSKQFPDYDWIGLIGIFVLLLGAFVAAYGVLSPLRQITSPSRNPPQTAELPQADPTALASANSLEQIPSVTEHTTRTLELSLLDKQRVSEKK